MNVKKSLLFLLIVLLLFFVYSCGGGSGSGYNPSGTGTGEVSKVELSPTRYIAQTNGCINIYARVIDGDGAYLSNTPVTFTNLSSIGQILNKCGGGQVTSATTDSNGLAKVALYSTNPGFATVQAEVNRGSGKVRDKKTVYFSFYKLELLPTLNLEVESVPSNEPAGQTIYNDIHDITLFENDSDDTVEVLATIYDIYGQPVAGESLAWSASHTEVKFRYAEAQTNIYGKAKAIVQVMPSSIRNTETSVNIMAYAGNGAANMTTLFLRPVNVNSVKVYANPSVVAPKGTSDVTAVVILNTGAPAPTSAVVNFTSTLPGSSTPCGIITPPFASITSGVASAKFIAPSTYGTCRVTASVGGKSGYVDIQVTEDVKLVPDEQTITNAKINDTAQYKIIGGVGPFDAYRDKPTLVMVSVSGSTVTAKVIKVPTDDETIKITVLDKSTGKTDDANLKLDISPTEELKIVPEAVTVTGIANPEPNPGDESDDVTFYVSGGIPPYTVKSDVPSVIASPGNIGNGPSFKVDPDDVLIPTTVTLTVTDSVYTQKSATVTVNPPSELLLSITLNKTNVVGLANPDGDTSDDVIFTVTGGSGPYVVTADKPGLISPSGSWYFTGVPPHSETVDPSNVTTKEVVTFTVVDNMGSSAEAKLNIYPTKLMISVNKSDVFGIGAADEPDTRDDITFMVTGGTAPYTVSIGTPTVNFYQPGTGTIDNGPWEITSSGDTHTIDPNSVISTKTVTLTVKDSAGAVATKEVTIQPYGPGLMISVNKSDVFGIGAADEPDARDDITFMVTGGTAPYTVSIGTPTVNFYQPGTGTIDNGPWEITSSGDTHTIDPDSVTSSKTVTLTVKDSAGAVETVTVTIQPYAPGLMISVDKPHVFGFNSSIAGDSSTADDITFTVTGGSPPYIVSIGTPPPVNFYVPNTNTLDNGYWTLNASGETYTIDPDDVSSDTIVTLTVKDNHGTVATTAVTIEPL